jgi:hypothetical protein
LTTAENALHSPTGLELDFARPMNRRAHM